jgi:hypothetical protein
LGEGITETEYEEIKKGERVNRVRKREIRFKKRVK